MLPTDLENYLIQCRNQHLPFDAVAAKLTQAGWNADIILSAKIWYLGNTEKPPNQENSTKIQNPQLFTTPASLDHYPKNHFHPIIWILLFLMLSVISFIILTTF